MTEVRKRRNGPEDETDKLLSENEQVPNNTSLKRNKNNRRIINIYHNNIRRFKNRGFLNSVKNVSYLSSKSETLCCLCRGYSVCPHRNHGSWRDDIDSEEDKNIDLSRTIPSGTNKTPHILESTLNKLPERWRNWMIRFISTVLLTVVFLLIIYGGPLALMIATLAVQVKCFQEIINIGYSVYRIHGLPWFRTLSWYFLVASNYFFYGESLIHYFSVLINRMDFVRFLVTYHRFISFCLYIIGFVLFVLSLVHKYYMKQFSLFAWTHVALLIVVTQSYLIIQNIFEGLIWFIVPVSMIIINDIWAYIFGFFFGRTPLIKVSPKKTWEGFIGGGIATVFFGLLPTDLFRESLENHLFHDLVLSNDGDLSYFLCQFEYFICPTVYNEITLGRMTIECEPSSLFRPQEYALPQFLSSVLQLFRLRQTVTVYPFVLHSFSMAIFSSVIGPFGGFFASGFKRAFKIKDFGDVIPGHGGIMDRFDCQFLMATFVNVYISSFIRSPSPQKLLQQVFALKPEQQLELFYSLKDSLENRGILTFHSD